MRSLDGAQNFDLSSATHPPSSSLPFLLPPHPSFHLRPSLSLSLSLSASLMSRVQFDDEKSSAEEEVVEEEEEEKEKDQSIVPLDEERVPMKNIVVFKGISIKSDDFFVEVEPHNSTVQTPQELRFHDLPSHSTELIVVC
ncbi:unnamed protein product [Rodentolepis nana]|uniref:PITH domain-containing protein n=1 Tax=Rodentolepis nana TaxID=102285 RepID=A0A0R3TZ59_RODNA|nr:unnamed protein product [Rodentolepis nana]